MNHNGTDFVWLCLWYFTSVLYTIRQGTYFIFYRLIYKFESVRYLFYTILPFLRVLMHKWLNLYFFRHSYRIFIQFHLLWYCFYLSYYAPSHQSRRFIFIIICHNIILPIMSFQKTLYWAPENINNQTYFWGTF